MLEKREPLVLLSFSTTFQNQREALQRAIDALGQLAVRALVTVGPALRREDFNAPANVVIRKSAPHSQVLPHVDAMITHAGHGSVVRALMSRSAVMRADDKFALAAFQDLTEQLWEEER